MTALLVVFTIVLFVGMDIVVQKVRARAKKPVLRPDGMFWSENLQGFTMADGGELIDEEKNKEG